MVDSAYCPGDMVLENVWVRNNPWQRLDWKHLKRLHIIRGFYNTYSQV
jgi:predicted transglutaminase-like cysteine proteinase